MGSFDAILAADGEKPFGGIEMQQLDLFSNFTCEFKSETMEGTLFVFEKGSSFGGSNSDSGGQMSQPRGVGGFIALLPSGTRTPRDIPSALRQECIIGKQTG